MAMPSAGEEIQEFTTIANDFLRATIYRTRGNGEAGYFLGRVDLNVNGEWRLALAGVNGEEFATSFGCMNAVACVSKETETGNDQVELSAQGKGWKAHEIIAIEPGQAVLRRTQTYSFEEPATGSICPGFLLRADEDTRYTYPVQAHEAPLETLPAIHIPADWAVPLPFHIWHNRLWAGIYGVDRSLSDGTIDFQQPAGQGQAKLRIYFPDCTDCPDPYPFEPGSSVTLHEVMAFHLLETAEEPLLEAERMAAVILLREPPTIAPLNPVIERIHAYYHHCQLWEPDAFGPGGGWFSNMWVRTKVGPAKKRGEMSGYYDLGWGEGIAVEMWMGAVRNWKRTGQVDLLPYVDEMTRQMDVFKRRPGDSEPYFDRSDGHRFGDFLMDFIPGQRIWTHSLGHSGCQLIQLYQFTVDYPNAHTRQQWLAAATSIARFFAAQQQENGDLQDGFDEQDREINQKANRIAARAVVCGLWVRLAQVTGERDWVQRALRLAKAAAPEIQRYMYCNQMIDTASDPALEAVDGEAACYVLEGLVPLYQATRDPEILALCLKAAAFVIAWTYFYHLPNAHNGIARGGQVCRTDIPLLYPIGPAKAVQPFLDLYQVTGDDFLLTMTREMIHFISKWQIDAPGEPWDGGIIHALDQHNGKHWGPDLAGQVDSGMATGNSLAALETWITHERS
jgi:hypothetical protein